MKKMLALAAITLCALAQAVTQNWSMSNFTYAKDQDLGLTNANVNKGRYNQFDVKFSDTSSMTTNGVASGTNVTLTSVRLCLTENDESYMTQPAYLLLMDGNNVVAASTDKSWTGSVKVYGGADAGEHWTSATWNYTFNATDLDADKVYTLVLATAYDSADNTYTQLSTSNDTWTNSQRIRVVSDMKNDTLAVDATYTPFVELAGTYEPLPEPTALALLAMGVAGLALKRKVK